MVGYGKLILFGEHFVVYGSKAIATGLKDLYISINLEEGSWNKDLDDETIKALEIILSKLNINKQFHLDITSTLPIKSNLGSSAAFLVAFLRALNNKYDLSLSDEEINNYAYEGEKIFHGTPSGIDNTCATYGSPIIYQKEKPIIPLKSKKPLHLLIVNTGQKLKSTKQAVEHFRKIKEELPADYLFKAYNSLIENVILSFEKGDINYIAKAINFNHGLLYSFGLSTKQIEDARYQLFELGALASKITGAGFGGNIYALFPSKDSALKAKEELSYKSFYTSI